ncbi:BT_3987 domain-containing protein [Pedobacter nutrimenti]|uniref:BT_3987 domain-containing protein n=1 Tax=Pedobacter nutrimenti TaxID=1241337 RepID=UPI00292D25C6|nr:DUF1735 domain-containing protein [Pedobacter nutrimenti]
MKVYSLIAVLFCTCLLSCKKDKLNSDSLAYVSQSVSLYDEIPVCSATVIPNMNYAVKNRIKGFPALLASQFSADVTVTATISTDKKLVEAYNNLNHDHYPALPENLFKIVGSGQVVIKAGHTRSVDSIQVQLNNFTGLPTGIQTYAVPVVLQSSTAGAVLASKLMFILFTISSNNLVVSIADTSGNKVISVALFNNRLGNNLANMNIFGFLNSAILQSAQVSLEGADASYVNAYNTANNTNYLPFPSGAYQLPQGSVTIPAHTLVSTNGIPVRLPDLSLFTVGTTYLLAVRIKDNGIIGIPQINASNGSNIMYVALTVGVNNIDASNSGLNGTTMDRTKWNITTNDTYPGYPEANMLVGDTTTTKGWFSSGGKNPKLVLDIGASNTVKGFNLFPFYSAITGITLEYSTNGAVFKPLGYWVGNGSANTQTIKFTTPVTARYFKFIITGAPHYVGIAQLNGIN